MTVTKRVRFEHHPAERALIAIIDGQGAPRAA